MVKKKIKDDAGIWDQIQKDVMPWLLKVIVGDM
jgi:hypothetical protein